VTPLYKALCARLGADAVIGSEYVREDSPPGMIVDGLRHEDAQQLSFDDETFSVVVSCEVFEHIPDPDRALREVRRVLKPAGELLLTVPFYPQQAASVRRAGIENGHIVHHLPAAYHGNPMSDQGSLVFSEYGWDILDRMRAAGFERPALRHYWSYEYGHLDVLNSVFHATRPELDPVTRLTRMVQRRLSAAGRHSAG